MKNLWIFEPQIEKYYAYKKTCMSKRKFILVSPEQESPETIVLDWSLCFICQSLKSNGSIFADDPTKSPYILTAENPKN